MATIVAIPIDRVRILNPRVRNRRAHREMIENIRSVGLKRPITVASRARPDGSCDFDLVCGQGRLEAFVALGRHEIPAIVEELPETECMLRSLVENIARRQHPALELMQRISELHARGYNDTQIGKKIGASSMWVSSLLGLIEHGEERLLSAVESGMLPISWAVEFAKCDEPGAQEALAKLYSAGEIKGKQLLAIRRLLARRARAGKTHRPTPLGRTTVPRKITADQAMRLYQQEVEKHKLLIKKAGLTQTQLLFVVQALKELRADPGFVALLREEGLHHMPSVLDARAPAVRHP